MPIRRPVFWDSERQQLVYKHPSRGWLRLGLSVGGGGGGGVTDHDDLDPGSLVWTASDHTGTPGTLAGFDGGGAADEIPVTDFAPASGIAYMLLVGDPALPHAREFFVDGTSIASIDLGAGSTYEIHINPTYTFQPSGAGHRVGLVPTPGAVAGTARYLREDATWVDQLDILSHIEDDRFGDGSDGVLTIGVGSTTTLGRDLQCTTIDLDGGTLDCAGYRVRCHELRDTTGGGVIHNNGGNGTGPSQGQNAPSGSLGGGAQGGGGATAGGNGSAGSARTVSWPSRFATTGVSGRGGAGAASGQGQTGGNSGTVSDPSANSGYGGWFMWETGRGPSDSVALNGGSGGGGGGCGAGAGARGGGGGGGGGVVMVFARLLAASASAAHLRARGGNGGNGTAGAAAGTGGGGGGGGGMVVLTYQSAAGGLPTLSAAGGNGGTGTGTGATGTAGATGATTSRSTRS